MSKNGKKRSSVKSKKHPVLTELAIKVVGGELIEWRKLEWLQPPNLKDCPPEAMAKLISSLKIKGFADPFKVWRDGKNALILDGHHRQKALLAIETEGIKVPDRLPATFVYCKDRKEAMELVLTYSSVYARIAEEGLFQFLSANQLDFGEIKIAIDLPDLNMIRFESRFLGQDNVETETPPLPSNPITKMGDLYQFGRHRLFCGDATDEKQVRMLLNGVKPNLMITDPPYGVDYHPDWRTEEAKKGNLSYAVRRIGKVKNDDKIDWSDAFKLFPGNVFYCWHADRHASTVQRSMEDAGFEIRCQIIWAKSNFAISRGHYHWKHEPCWYAVRTGKDAGWIGDCKQTTLWEINLDKNVDGGHATQKPVECMLRALQNHQGDVYDPFVGSGTSTIAAERLGRASFCMEIDPGYCDVVISRWVKFTGKSDINLNGKKIRWKILYEGKG